MQIHGMMIEWDSSVEPEVFLSTSPREVALRAAVSVSSAIDHDDAAEFLAGNANTVLGIAALTNDELDAWHEGFRESTTVPWITFFEQEV